MHLRFSRDLTALLEKLAEHPLTLADILTETAERGFCLVIGLLALPFLFPMPPGFTTILGSASLLLAVQMAIGRRIPWLPRRIAAFQFPKAFVLQLLKNLRRLTGLLEKIAKPRWLRFAQSSHVWQVNGACIAWLTLLLMTPIPFTNPIPTVGILVLAIATLETDGLLMFIGYSLVGFNTALFGSVAYLLWRSPDIFTHIFQ
ncbi:MAG: exopolysaccharide biosynthesis protein [Leptolyngbyaceae bacterium]|nr:exopolysaccharide biosynthesis protein [Leptolyngbyaceae bacterium]